VQIALTRSPPSFAAAAVVQAHGSNIDGLETEAVYDAAGESFVLDSPSATATKWWAGNLGKSATHAIVMAQLMLPAADSKQTATPKLKRMGVHAFVVPLRDVATHRPLPGIELGDLGP
jgi:hypothetical protein